MSTTRRSGSWGSSAGRGLGERLVGPELAAQLEREHLDEPRVALGRGLRGGIEEPPRPKERRARLAPRRGHGPERRASERGGESRDAPGERVGAIALVPAEGLVAAVADERDLHVPARRLADEQRRQRRLVAERLVEGLGDPLEQLRPRIDLELLVRRPEPLRDGPGVRPLVVAAVRETDRERPHRLGRGLRHRRDHDRGVEPAREQRPERHVGDEPAADGRGHLVANPLDPLAFARGGQGPPVALDPHRAALDHDVRAGGTF